MSYARLPGRARLGQSVQGVEDRGCRVGHGRERPLDQASQGCRSRTPQHSTTNTHRRNRLHQDVQDRGPEGDGAAYRVDLSRRRKPDVQGVRTVNGGRGQETRTRRTGAGGPALDAMVGLSQSLLRLVTDLLPLVPLATRGASSFIDDFKLPAEFEEFRQTLYRLADQAVAAAQPREPVCQHAAREEIPEFLLHELR